MTIGKPVTLVALSGAAFLMGCSSHNGDTPSIKFRRPVSVFQLAESDGSRMDRLSGSVDSWKTEDLGFEVPGRVQFVIEPETDIEGGVFAPTEEENDGGQHRVLLKQGQVLARLDDTRYRLAVKSAQAQIETAIQQKNAASIELTQVIPAQRDAAVADLNYRKSEAERNQPLVRSGAVSRAEFAKIQADYNASIAVLAEVDANKQAKQAEVASLMARIDELNESLAQAERDVQDCELRAPFRGQVAQVHVIPGGVVQAGQSVVTVQMMDPIHVELEVSAATSRRLNYRDVVDVITLTGEDDGLQPGGNSRAKESRERAFVYSIDPAADPTTRTFTVTLLVRNQKVQSPPPDDFVGQVIRVRDVWELQEAPFVKEGAFFLETNAIHSEGGDHYVWRITNWEQVARKETTVLNVTRVRVIPGDLRVDWLGLWTFREIAIADGEEFDIEHDFVAGEFDATEPFRGDSILLDRQKWRLRPGDVVGVELSGARLQPGFYVPIDAIRAAGGKTYVCEVSDDHVRLIEVDVSAGPDTLKRIEAKGDRALTAGMQLVLDGVHYLVEGEAVNVVEEVQVQR